jgi:cytochrome P450
MRKRELRKSLPPGPKVPGALQMAATWKRPAGSLERLRQRYGKRITVQLPFQPPFVILADPEEIKALFQAPPDVIHPGEGARILEPIVGSNSVILLDEAAHLEQRKLLLPAFHGEKMQRLTGVMTELAEQEITSWPTGQPTALHPRLQRVTLEIILRAVFGLERGPQFEELRDTLTGVLAFSESPLSVLPAIQRIAPMFGTFRRFRELVTHADELIFALIEERRALAAEARPVEAGENPSADTADHGGDVLAMLLQARHEDGSPMSDQELRDELMTALVAGHETTASQLAWAFERLAREPAVTAKLTAEIDGAGTDEYLTATVNEILRLKPVLPNAEPRLTKQRVRVGGFEYPAGVALLASAYLVHHDPEIYPDPYAFRPERFLKTQPGTYTWIPFGGGRRRCLGASFAIQEMKIVLKVALTHFELEPATARSEQTGRRSITFSPREGATVILRPRRGSASLATTQQLAAAGA